MQAQEQGPPPSGRRDPRPPGRSSGCWPGPAASSSGRSACWRTQLPPSWPGAACRGLRSRWSPGRAKPWWTIPAERDYKSVCDLGGEHLRNDPRKIAT